VETHFSQRIKEVGERFSGDQDSAAERFQADVSQLERHYQTQLGVLAESHARQALGWRAEVDAALLEAEGQRRLMREATEQAQDPRDLENAHREEVEVLSREKRIPEAELDDLMGSWQTKEMDLSRQLNELHRRLQESQDSRDDLLAASERQTLEQALLRQAVEDFKQEKAELQNSLAQLEVKYKEAVAQLEERSQEKMEHFDALKSKVEDLEAMLQQAAVDFELERQELQQSIADLEEELEHHLCCRETLENERVELISERGRLHVQTKEMENEISALLAAVELTKYHNNKIETSHPGNELEDEPLHLDGVYLSSRDREPQPNPCENTFNLESESLTDREQTKEDDDEDDGCVDVAGSADEGVETANPNSWSSSAAFGGPRGTSAAPLLEQHRNNPLEMITESPKVTGECPEDTDCLVVVYDDDDVATHKANVDKIQEMQSSHVPEEVKTEEKEDGEAVTSETFSAEDLCPPPPRGSPSKDNNTADLRVSQETRSVEADGETLEQRSGGEAHKATSPEAVASHEEGTTTQGYDVVVAVAVKSWDEENNPQDEISDHHKPGPRHDASVVGLFAPEEMGDSRGGEPTPREEDVAVDFSSVDSQCGKRADSVSHEGEPSAQGLREAAHRDAPPGHREAECPVSNLRVLCSDAIEENLLLHQKISLLQQKAVMLESILTHNKQTIETGRRALEENLHLKLQMLSLVTRARELEARVSDAAELRARCEDGWRDNVRLREWNGELRRRVSSLESRLRAVCGLQGQQNTAGLVGEISRMRRENAKLSELLRDLELQEDDDDDDVVGTGQTAVPEEEEVHRSCVDLEVQNADLRRALANLQGQSLTLSEWMQAHR